MLILDAAAKQRLIRSAFQAKGKAYNRHSRFSVGAALLCGDGDIVTGCSVDNAVYSLSTCAEQVVAVKAVSEGKFGFSGLAIVSDINVPITPCGTCRQLLIEFCDPAMPVLLLARDCLSPDESVIDPCGIKTVELGDLLPLHMELM